MQFGIFNEILAQQAGVPSIKLPDGIANAESSFMRYWRGAARRCPGRESILAVMPDGNAVLRYWYHRSVGRLEYLFAFTQEHAYILSGSSWVLMFICSLPCSSWSVESFGTYVVATNNLDKVQYWSDTTPATAFAPLGGADGIDYGGGAYVTRAAYVIKHWNYLHLLGTSEDGTQYLNRDRWCSAGDATDFDATGSGDANYRDLGPNDEIAGAAVYNVQGSNHLIIGTQRSVNAAWLVTDDVVYESQDILTGTGVVPGSIIPTPDGQVYFFSLDKEGIVEMRRVYDPTILSYDVQTVLDRMHPDLRSSMCATYFGPYRELWWAIPSTGSSTGNDSVLVYSLITESWQPSVPIDISAFGYWTQQTTEYIDDCELIIDEVHELIDSFAPVAGNPLTLVSDYNGYSWTMTGTQDRDGDYTGALVLSVIIDRQAMNRFMRLHGAWLYFVSHAGTSDTVGISVRTSEKSVYRSLGTVSLDADNPIVRKWIRFDVRTRHFEVKLAAQNPFEFLGILFDYDPTGERL